jgi:GTPase SAR1 family protein
MPSWQKAEKLMAVKLGRPILIGGVGLSFSLWMLESLHHEVVQVGEFGMLGAIALGAGFWMFQQRSAKNIDLTPIFSSLNRETVEGAIAQAAFVITQLEAEVQNHQEIATLRQQVATVTAELDRQDMRLAVTGGKNVGKTTLMRVIGSIGVPQQQQKISLKETPALFAATDADITAETMALELAIASDLVLFLTTGDLTDPEFQTLQQLTAANQRIMLVFNKQDQYLPEERPLVLQQLRQRMQGMVRREDVVATASSPVQVKVRQHQADGSVQEWMEQPAPDMAQLTQQLGQILLQESQQLIWASTFRAALALKAEAKTVLNGVLRDRALPLIEQFQWIAAGTAAANPVPALDLLATAAINAQLVIDLGAIYQQKFSLQQAQAVAGTLGSLMLKLGLVELSSQTIGSILKSNAITFVAGGVVQGVSAAYLTRLAGLSLIEYFQAQEAATTTDGGLLNLDKLGETLRNVFQQNQRVAFLQSFVKQGVARLLPESPQPEINGSL